MRISGRFTNGGIEIADVLRLEYLEKRRNKHWWACFRKSGESWELLEVVDEHIAMKLIEYARENCS